MGFFSKILSVFKRSPKIDWDDLEALLIQGDMGIHFTTAIIDQLKAKGRDISPEEVVDVCREEIIKLLPAEHTPLKRPAAGPAVVLITGINGVGKTTSTAKLAHYLKKNGESVVLAAADTFRAAAIEQLEVWSQRIGVPMVKGAYKADPAGVCYDAYEHAVKTGAGFLLCDTAGRLHTRHNLMEELGKIRRVLGRKDETSPHETLLVVDATTGSNGLAQAREFQKALDGLSGVIVTKLDGSGKGGVVVSIQKELGVPARFMGTGETADDFSPFDARQFVEKIL